MVSRLLSLEAKALDEQLKSMLNLKPWKVMNLSRRNSFLPSSTSLFDDLLPRDLFDWSQTGGNGLVPRVNIRETDDGFAVELAAPGMKKEDFQLELDNDMLTVSSETSTNEEEQKQNYTRKEFR